MEGKPLILRGGTVVCEHEVLANHDVVIEEGRITAVRPSGACPSLGLIESAQSIIDAAADHTGRTGESSPDAKDRTREPSPDAPVVIDAKGCYVVPGIIDIHSDYIESVASPRPNVILNLASSLFEAERELVAHGVTTIYHSLSLYQQKIFDHKPIRNFENVSALIGHIQALRTGEERNHLIRHRLHLRVEIDAVDLFEAIKGYLAGGVLDLISFMDHTPGQGQYADLKVFGTIMKGYRDISDEAIAEIVTSQQASSKLSLEQMVMLSRMAREQGIAVASHDDDTCEKLDLMEQVGTSISEFPITLAVAKSARERGMHTLAGAPNVVAGRSHSDNLSAREAVCDGLVDILCSDYYPASLLSAVFTLHQDCKIGLAQAFALVSLNPARAVHLDKEFGSIATGKRADVLLVRELEDGTPVVTQSFVGGHRVYQSYYPQFVPGIEGEAATIDAQRETVSVM